MEDVDFGLLYILETRECFGVCEAGRESAVVASVEGFERAGTSR